jgi:hypothetical protein
LVISTDIIDFSLLYRMGSLLTEGNLVKGTSYTAKFSTGKEFLGEYGGIVNIPYVTNISQQIPELTEVHSFPERETGVDKSKYFPVGHFKNHGITFEEGNTVGRGGRRTARSTRSRRRQSRRSQSRRRQSRRQ